MDYVCNIVDSITDHNVSYAIHVDIAYGCGIDRVCSYMSPVRGFSTEQMETRRLCQAEGCVCVCDWSV